LYHNLGMTLMAHLEEEQRQGDQAAIVRDIARARHALEEALRLGTQGAALAGFPQWEPARTHALLGQVLFSLGDRAAAREHLETALRLEPSGPVADRTRQYMRRLE
jgi:tetratricopeptide (TPR) repeat protein